MSPLALLYRKPDRLERAERQLQRTPVVLLEYRLELALGLWGLLSGPVRVVLPQRQGSVDDVLPTWGVVFFGVLMTLGAITTLWGLRGPVYGRTVGRGLELLGLTFACYAVALVLAWTLPACLLGLLLVLLAGLCWFSSRLLFLQTAMRRRQARSELATDLEMTAVEEPGPSNEAR